MQLLLNADAIIKLFRSGILTNVVNSYRCVLPSAVYEEVVTRGKERLHQDAGAIEAVSAGAVTITPIPKIQKSETGLGAGEFGILKLLRMEADEFVVSDDRRFLSVLMKRHIMFLIPADIIVLLARQKIITRAKAMEALELLRPLIRTAAYYEAREDLEYGGK